MRQFIFQMAQDCEYVKRQNEMMYKCEAVLATSILWENVTMNKLLFSVSDAHYALIGHSEITSEYHLPMEIWMNILLFYVTALNFSNLDHLKQLGSIRCVCAGFNSLTTQLLRSRNFSVIEYHPHRDTVLREQAIVMRCPNIAMRLSISTPIQLKDVERIIPCITLPLTKSFKLFRGSVPSNDMVHIIINHSASDDVKDQMLLWVSYGEPIYYLFSNINAPAHIVRSIMETCLRLFSRTVLHNIFATITTQRRQNYIIHILDMIPDEYLRLLNVEYDMHIITAISAYTGGALHTFAAVPSLLKKSILIHSDPVTTEAILITTVFGFTRHNKTLCRFAELLDVASLLLVWADTDLLNPIHFVMGLFRYNNTEYHGELIHFLESLPHSFKGDMTAYPCLNHLIQIAPKMIVMLRKIIGRERTRPREFIFEELWCADDISTRATCDMCLKRKFRHKYS